MQHFLKEKADQVEEWKQRWTQIEESLSEKGISLNEYSVIKSSD